MSRSTISLVAVAGLYGAIGVATAAAAAHLAGDTRLATASNFLLLHAAAILGAVGAGGALGLGRFATVPAWLLAAGALLFCGDLLVRVAFGASPLPMAAPTGGTLLIVGWIALSIGAVWGGLRAARRHVG
ncbi:DUF423 domain-containing protein [Hansschlegelia sp. KR7-227]|uniref:DUF423 domain-containing protein n=1 Tax=Hansschlegelia sp. KR7-227 TaxID=3400914 RepID=UPI003C11E51C